jgi:glutathione S-transferase
VAQAFRHIHPAMKEWEVPQIPEWGEANKPKAVEFLHLFDRELATREFAAGDEYSIADITGLVAIDFMKPARIRMPEECANVLRWHAAVSSRPSAAA